MSRQSYVDRVDPARLPEFFHLDKATGRLTWRPLPMEMFRHGAVSPETWKSRWDAENVGKEAFRIRELASWVARTSSEAPKRPAVRRSERLMGRAYQGHHVVWAMVHGHWPTGDIIHKNGDKTDNTPSNLEAWPRGKKNNRYQKLSSPDSPPSPFTKPKPKQGSLADTSTPEQFQSPEFVTTSQKSAPSRASRPDISHGPDAQELFCNLLHREISTGKLYWRNTDRRYAPGREAFTAVNDGGYRQGRLRGHALYAHRVIWVMVYGEWPGSLRHRNGDRTDNRLSNLYEMNPAARPVDHTKHHSLTRTDAENTDRSVTPVNPENPWHGVIWAPTRRRWIAQSHHPCTGKPQGFIGLFDTAKEARDAIRDESCRCGDGLPRIPALCPVRGWDGVYARDPCDPHVTAVHPAGEFYIRVQPRDDRPQYRGPYDSVRKAFMKYTEYRRLNP